MAWGATVEDAFDRIVFLRVPTDIRVARLKARERERYGNADPAFLEWASEYESGPPVGRSLAKHEAWLRERKCPIVRIEGDTSVNERIGRVTAALPTPLK